jgi:hypothetical protein
MYPHEYCTKIPLIIPLLKIVSKFFVNKKFPDNNYSIQSRFSSIPSHYDNTSPIRHMSEKPNNSDESTICDKWILSPILNKTHPAIEGNDPIHTTN